MGDDLPDVNEIVTANDIIDKDMVSINAMSTAALAQKKQEIENKYAEQKAQSDIDYKNALTKYNNLQSDYYGADTESQIANRNALTRKTNFDVDNPLLGGSGVGSAEANLNWLKNKFGADSPDYKQALEDRDVNNQASRALSQQRMLGGSAGMGVDQKALLGLNRQLQTDHPDWSPDQINDASNQYLAGNSNFSDGKPLPKLGGQASQLMTLIQNKNAPAAIKNQAASLDVLVGDLNNFDIDAFKQMSGPQGKIRLAKAKAQMAVNPNDPNIDPVARRYIASLNDVIGNMDSMRKAYGTSVVPDYVYATMGQLANPNSSIMSDSTQAEMNFKNVLNRMTQNRDAYFEKVRHGVTAGSSEDKSEKSGSKPTPEEARQELIRRGKLKS